jgi:hypothetical protein
MSERPWTGVQIVGASNGVGVIIEDGIAHDLNGMLPNDSPWRITRASGIKRTDHRRRHHPGGPWRALLLTPQP